MIFIIMFSLKIQHTHVCELAIIVKLSFFIKTKWNTQNKTLLKYDYFSVIAYWTMIITLWKIMIGQVVFVELLLFK